MEHSFEVTKEAFGGAFEPPGDGPHVSSRPTPWGGLEEALRVGWVPRTTGCNITSPDRSANSVRLFIAVVADGSHHPQMPQYLRLQILNFNWMVLFKTSKHPDLLESSPSFCKKLKRRACFFSMCQNPAPNSFRQPVNLLLSRPSYGKADHIILRISFLCHVQMRYELLQTGADPYFRFHRMDRKRGGTIMGPLARDLVLADRGFL